MTPRRPARGRPVLRTDRLELRPLTWDDLPRLEQLDADPEVMRFLDAPGGPDEARERTLARLDPGDDAMGLGYWTGLERGRFVGTWLLTPQGPGLGEIGWRLLPPAWGQGLATEGARALLEHGFTAVGLERVVAETRAGHHASRAVMRRLGMRPCGLGPSGEWLAEVTREQWSTDRA